MFHCKSAWVLLIAFTLASPAWAQKSKGRTMASSQAKPKRAVSEVPKPSGFGLQFLSWQESLKGEDSGVTLNLDGEFWAIGVGYNREYFRSQRSKRWLINYSGALFMGTAKAYGEVGTLVHNLKGQNFYGVKAEPGIYYRTARNTDIGLSAVALGRYVGWKYQSGSDLDIEQPLQFTIGLAVKWRFLFANLSRFSMGIGYQHTLPTAVWQLTFDF